VLGVGSARAAISVVNALPLGVGAAVGIEWPATATARFSSGGDGSERTVVRPPRARTPLVRAAARSARSSWAPGSHGLLAISLRSTIPPGRGLKSSSAVASAVALATARAGGRSPAAHDVARISARVGREVAVSATGAFDDALAGLLPGVVVTDNRTDAELRRFPIDRGCGVVIWVPGGRHPRSPSVRPRFRRDRALAQRAVDAALDRDWIAAMSANSELVERAMRYPYSKLRTALAGAGALAAGVSGLGPTVAAVAPVGRLPGVLRAFPRRGVRRVLRFSSTATAPPGGR
jgi:shikimate kinase